jgi:hypothetical protein
MEFLETYNGFLPSVTEAKDGHFINPIHLLQYCDLLKIPDYDAHCPTFKEKHSRLCCSICNKYFSTITFLTKHKRTAHLTAQRRSKNILINRLRENRGQSMIFLFYSHSHQNVLFRILKFH